LRRCRPMHPAHRELERGEGEMDVVHLGPSLRSIDPRARVHRGPTPGLKPSSSLQFHVAGLGEPHMTGPGRPNPAQLGP
jgi:hypothetical protein